MVVEVVVVEVQGRAGWSQPANQPPESRLPESRGREGGHHRPHLTVNPGSSTCNSCSRPPTAFPEVDFNCTTRDQDGGVHQVLQEPR